MTKPTLIVGGGPAGLAAAQALGALGHPTVLVEKEDRLGGAPILSGYAKLVPSGEWAKDAIGGMVQRQSQLPPVFQQLTASRSQTWQRAECSDALRDAAFHIWDGSRLALDRELAERRPHRAERAHQ